MKPQLSFVVRDHTPLWISKTEHGVHHLVDAPANAIFRLGEPFKKIQVSKLIKGKNITVQIKKILTKCYGLVVGWVGEPGDALDLVVEPIVQLA